MGHGEVAIAAAFVTAVATGMRTEDEAGEEDDRDDEDDACDDADPRGDRGEPGAARFAFDESRRWLRSGVVVATGAVAGSGVDVGSLMVSSMQTFVMRLY